MDKQQIHEAIKEYRWMMKLLISKREDTMGSLTAQYGIEATMPKPQGNPTDPVYQEILRIEKHDRHIDRIRNKVMFVQQHSKCIHNTRNKLILDLLLDGLTLREVAIEMDMSLSGVKRRKDIIVNRMYAEQKEQKEII